MCSNILFLYNRARKVTPYCDIYNFRKCIALHFRFVNVSGFEVAGIKARLCLAAGIVVTNVNNNPNIINIDLLPPKQSKLCTVTTALHQFTDGQGFLQVT